MRSAQRIILFICAVLGISAAPNLIFTQAMADPSSAQLAVSPADTTADEVALAAGANQFAFRLYHHLRPAAGNFCFSPYNITRLTSLLALGGEGETARQLKDATFITLPGERHHQAISLITDQIDRNSAYHLVAKNILWYRMGFSFHTDFLRQSRPYYSVAISGLNFIDNPLGSQQRVNQWADEVTGKRISSLALPGIDMTKQRLLGGSLFFLRSSWQFPFDTEATSAASFYISDSSSVLAQLMRQTEVLLYGETTSCRLIDLPYRDSALIFTVILPNEPGGLVSLEESLSLENWRQWRQQMEPKPISLAIPAFTLASVNDCRPALIALGAKDIWSLPPADFSGITGYKDLFLSGVIDGVYLTIDELGSQAASGESPVPEVDSKRDNLVDFVADHPFIIVVHHAKSGLVLIAGRIASP